MLLPALRSIEQSGHSVAIAALRKGRSSTPAVQRTPLVTLERGMGSLIEAMAARLSGPIRTGVRIESLEPVDRGWRLGVAGEDPIEADQVVLALPADAAAALVSPHDRELAAALSGLPASDSQTVTFLWGRGVVELPEKGTGFLVPRPEQQQLAACTWVSEKWHHRADDGLMVRCFMRSPGSSDGELIDAAQAEMRRLMGVSAEPLKVIVRQWSKALPVMEVGHHERVAQLHERVRRLPGLALAGAGLEGTGLPACIRSGHNAAELLRATSPAIAEA
jgi:oxygen-dependent protoporphyrinogen oxidase